MWVIRETNETGDTTRPDERAISWSDGVGRLRNRAEALSDEGFACRHQFEFFALLVGRDGAKRHLNLLSVPEAEDRFGEYLARELGWERR